MFMYCTAGAILLSSVHEVKFCGSKNFIYVETFTIEQMLHNKINFKPNNYEKNIISSYCFFGPKFNKLQ